MKKILGILAIAGTLVACGNSGETTTTEDTMSTTTVAPIDTTTGIGTGMDTANRLGTDTAAGAMGADTTTIR